MASAAANDPYTCKWLVEKDTSLLSLNFPAGLTLTLEDIVVRVDGKRRLTITDRHKKPKPGAGGEAPAPRLNKTFRFQLPKTANPDAITGCFDGAVLTLTVPSGRKQQPQQPAGTVGAAKEPADDPKAKAEQDKKLIDTAVAAAAKEAEEPKANAEQEKKLIDTAVAVAKEAEEPKAKAEQEKKPIDTAVAVAKEAEEPKANAEQEKKPIDMAVAAAKETEQEKKLIDTAVAAFRLGVLFSHRLFSPAGSRN